MDTNWCAYCDKAVSTFSDSLYCSDDCLKSDALAHSPMLGYDFSEYRGFLSTNVLERRTSWGDAESINSVQSSSSSSLLSSSSHQRQHHHSVPSLSSSISSNTSSIYQHHDDLLVSSPPTSQQQKQTQPKTSSNNNMPQLNIFLQRSI
ncbi:hypothetical protein BDC45DRAFT_567855 [Circinella umbellata]|nr:hypothetical protein BDC45DRAFT_567855 [Circinella umbellata]